MSENEEKPIDANNGKIRNAVEAAFLENRRKYFQHYTQLTKRPFLNVSYAEKPLFACSSCGSNKTLEVAKASNKLEVIFIPFLLCHTLLWISTCTCRRKRRCIHMCMHDIHLIHLYKHTYIYIYVYIYIYIYIYILVHT